MKIAIDATRILYQKAGIGQYAYHLLKSLSKIDEENEYLLYFTVPQVAQWFKIQSWKKKNFKNKIIWIDGRERNIKPADIFHDPGYMLPFKFNRGNKNIITIQDLAFLLYPKLCTTDATKFYLRYLPTAAEKVDKIITPSYCTKKDVVAHFTSRKKKLR